MVLKVMNQTMKETNVRGSTNPVSREPGYSMEGDVKAPQGRGYGIARNF